MRSRLDLDDELRDFLGSDNVYFQPPESIKIKYPCIIYKLAVLNARPADNIAYFKSKGYDVTIIAKDPDFPLFDEIIDRFPMCRLGNRFTYDNLNHATYTIFY